MLGVHGDLQPFDEAEIRAAERALIRALEAPDPTAWVHAYTEDAVNGRPPDAGSVSNVRLIIVWRKEADGLWRIAQELLHAEPTGGWWPERLPFVGRCS